MLFSFLNGRSVARAITTIAPANHKADHKKGQTKREQKPDVHRDEKTHNLQPPENTSFETSSDDIHAEPCLSRLVCTYPALRHAMSTDEPASPTWKGGYATRSTADDGMPIVNCQVIRCFCPSKTK